jgi:zinc transporter ZupT
MNWISKSTIIYTLSGSSLILVSLLWRYNIVLSFILLGLGISIIFFMNPRRDWILFTTAGISGAIAEAIGIKFGAWTYTNPTYVIPIWLPILWGVAALFIKKLSLDIKFVLDFLKD